LIKTTSLPFSLKINSSTSFLAIENAKPARADIVLDAINHVVGSG
jgi:hypothetical protein